MKFSTFFLTALLVLFSNASFATNADEWVYKNTTGSLKQTPGCKDKAAAAKQASTGYRFQKYTRILCNDLGYGWGINEVVDKGKLVCDECEGEYENTEKYRCQMVNVTVNCKQVVR
jgi:hypothetical protein